MNEDCYAGEEATHAWSSRLVRGSPIGAAMITALRDHSLFLNFLTLSSTLRRVWMQQPVLRE
jgi:hypothetical protein